MSLFRLCGVVFVSLGTVGVCFSGIANGADTRPAPRNGTAVDHPLGLVAFASFDRLRARAASLAEALGTPEDAEKLLFAISGGEDSPLPKLINSPGFDTTRPLGVMFFPNWVGDGGELTLPIDSVMEPGLLADDPLSYLAGALSSIFVENATLVVCIPAKDRQQLLKGVCELISGDEWTEVPTQPGWYQVDENDDVRIGFAGTYLLIVAHDGDVKRFDRNYPEFDKLAGTSLGKNGFVYSLYRRGLPAIVRDGLLPAFKLSFAARFQQQDDEPELDFRLRTMFGQTQLELMELMISDVDEVRVTGHVDSATSAIIVEPELVGPKDGRLAKYCNQWKVRNSPFANLASDDSASISAVVSLPLALKSWKPLSDVLYRSADSLGLPKTADVLRTVARTVDSGQLDLYTFNPSWKEGLVAFRITGNAQFPEQFEQMFAELSSSPILEVAVDSVEGFPIHRSLTTMDSHPLLIMLSLPLQAVLGTAPELPDLNQSDVETEVEVETIRVSVEADGTQTLVTERGLQTIPAAQDAIWLAATPQALWIGFGGSKKNENCPEWFKSQVAASLANPASSAASKGKKIPFQLTMRGLGASVSESENAADPNSPKPEIHLTNGVDTENESTLPAAAKSVKARADILRDKPNAVRLELQPTDRGAKLRIIFEEAYFHWFAAFMKAAVDEAEAGQ